jgi:hypothetical protein
MQRHSPLNRHPELVSGSIYQPQPAVCEKKWMLKQVQHDDVLGGEA